MNRSQDGQPFLRPPLVAGNWKLHKNPQQASDFLKELLNELSSEEQRHFIVFPPALSCSAVVGALEGTAMAWGAQNVGCQIQGAFTGENSAQMVKQMGGQFVLVGHSERRYLYGETLEQTAQKMLVACEQGLIPVLCVGETLEEREGGSTEKVVAQQLVGALELLKSEFLDSELGGGSSISEENRNAFSFVVAYEPVWAIGTGRVATPEVAEEVHAFVRKKLKSYASHLEAIPLLYGGSVKPQSSARLFAQPSIDGFLVGSASLEVASFVEIYKRAQAKA